MRRCEACGVAVAGTGKRCPLCHIPLPDEGREPALYPDPPAPQRRGKETGLWRRIVNFCLICSALICALINLLTGGEAWSAYVVASVAFYILVQTWTASRRGIGAKLLVPALSSIAYLVTLDALIGYSGWALDLVAPLILVATMLAMGSITLARRLSTGDLFFIILALMAFTLVPITLWLFGIVRIAWPSLSAGFVAAVMLAGLHAFGDRTMLSEIRRKLHL